MATPIPSVEQMTFPRAVNNRNPAVSIMTGAVAVPPTTDGQFWPTPIPVTIQAGGTTEVAFTRTTANIAPGSLAAGASVQTTVTLANSYRLLAIACSAPARVRLYTTTAKQAADLARASGTDPVGDHGLVLDFTATASVLAADLSPLVDGFDGKSTPDGSIPVTITNTGASPAAITCTLTWIRTE